MANDIKLSYETAKEIATRLGDACPVELTDAIATEDSMSEPITIDGVYYTDSEQIRFIREVQDDFDVELYHGRYFYHGPAVRCDDEAEMDEVKRLTTVPCATDNMGLGYIVYPQSSDPKLKGK